MNASSDSTHTAVRIPSRIVAELERVATANGSTLEQVVADACATYLGGVSPPAVHFGGKPAGPRPEQSEPESGSPGTRG